MKHIYRLLLLFMLVFSPFLLLSQNTIKGKILDIETDEGLPGVTILIENSNEGTTTDIDGNFSLTTNKNGEVNLVISFVGFRTETMPVFLNGNIDLGTLDLEPEAMALEEVEVLASFVDDKRQPPTPITTISALEIEQKIGAQEFPEMMKSTPGVFVSTVGGSFGDARVRIRGFGSENTAVLINGIPVNDMENGAVFWSNWGGMNDVTRNQQVQRGLGASKLAVSSVGGTINIITKPTEFRKGVQVSYAFSNRSWQHRGMISASTGLIKDSWALTVLGSTRQGTGFRQGTNTEAWAYFLSAYKKIGAKQQIVFTAFGAPQTTDRGSNATERSFEIVGDKTYNPAWGFKDGKKLNARQNRYHKPKFILNHYFDITPKATLTTSIYYSFGRGGGTSIDRTADAQIVQTIPFSLETLPADILDNPNPYQVQWDAMVQETRNSPLIEVANANGISGNTIIGRRSKYALVESRNDHDWFGVLSTFNKNVNDNFSYTVGIDYRWYRGFHYRTVVDLLGGDFWLDYERFNLQPANNLLRPNTAAKVGDKIGYDYTGTVDWLGFFGQVEYSWRNVDMFLTGTFVSSSFQRNGKFLHEEFPTTSLGKSKKFVFNDYTVKAGFNYKITGRHNAFFNAGYFSRAPFFQDAFVDARTSNDIRGELESEKILSFELGYGYRSPRFASNLNFYYTDWSNRTYTIGFFSNTYNDFVNFRMFNVGAIHQGIEFDFEAQVTSQLSIKGMASVGDWRWNGNASAVVLSDPGLTLLNSNQTVYIDRLKVGGSAQTVAALGAHYKGRKFWYAGAGLNYYDNLYSEYSPEEKTNSEAFFNQVNKLPSAFTVDFYAGKSFKFGDYLLKLKANVNNIFDNQFIIDSNQRNATDLDPRPSPFVQYYFGRTYFFGIELSF